MARGKDIHVVPQQGKWDRIFVVFSRNSHRSRRSERGTDSARCGGAGYRHRECLH
jgi:hypothetical protein